MKTLNLQHITIDTTEQVESLPLMQRLINKYGTLEVLITRYDGVVVTVIVGEPLPVVVPDYVEIQLGTLDITSGKAYSFPDMDLVVVQSIEEYARINKLSEVILRYKKRSFLGTISIESAMIKYNSILPIYCAM